MEECGSDTKGLIVESTQMHVSFAIEFKRNPSQVCFYLNLVTVKEWNNREKRRKKIIGQTTTFSTQECSSSGSKFRTEEDLNRHIKSRLLNWRDSKSEDVVISPPLPSWIKCNNTEHK